MTGTNKCNLDAMIDLLSRLDITGTMKVSSVIKLLEILKTVDNTSEENK